MVIDNKVYLLFICLLFCLIFLHMIHSKKEGVKVISVEIIFCGIQTHYTAGPREAWHDLHCKVEGPAAYDILTNFEQRWKKAKKWRNLRLKKVTNWHDDALLKLDRISWIATPLSGAGGEKTVHVTEENDPETWNVQVWIKRVETN